MKNVRYVWIVAYTDAKKNLDLLLTPGSFPPLENFILNLERRFCEINRVQSIAVKLVIVSRNTKVIAFVY